MPSHSADKDLPVAERAAAQQPHACADDVGADGGCQVIQGSAQPPVMRNGVLLLPKQQGGEPATLELVNRLRDGAS